jgi:biotin transport system substrate-specific component
MSTLTLAVGRPTLADRLVRRSLATDLVLIAAGAALTSIAAQVAVPLWPVPITGQTLAVLIVGSSLGAVRGMLSMVLYAVLGIVGLPVFSDASHGVGVLFGATGGYIIGFILAAGLTGWLAQRTWDHRVLGAFVSFLAGSIITFAVGLPWLAVVGHFTLAQTLQYGLYPFIIGGIIKAALAAVFIRLAWFGVNRADEQRAAKDTE